MLHCTVVAEITFVIVVVAELGLVITPGPLTTLHSVVSLGFPCDPVSVVLLIPHKMEGVLEIFPIMVGAATTLIVTGAVFDMAP